MVDDYKIINGKKLRYGYTTGTCAAAAAKAATALLLGAKGIQEVAVSTPSGKRLYLPLEDIKQDETAASCAVRKDAGDDPDVTHGMLVYARAEPLNENKILIEGGEGVGRVTKPGLDMPVGEAAINRTPRRMIQENVAEMRALYGYNRGIRICIAVPGGEALAKRTFNPRLGIEGGLSILGTSGIVEPMSDAGVTGAVRAELSVRRGAGEKTALITPGNYGKRFLADFEYAGRLPQPVKCGNFIGDTIDMAAALGFGRILVAGHIGKLIKLVTGNFNTHSKYGDPRLMIFAAFAGLGNPELKDGDPPLIPLLFECPSSEEAIALLRGRQCWDAVLGRILAGIQTQLDYRRGANPGGIQIGAVLFSSTLGLLGCTEGAAEILSGL
jgi:cobalt-precorrin-5B (C1)-methyltransferase